MSSDTPSQTSILFARGVIARLAYWPALRIAVDQLWGGPESAAKRTWLASVLVDDFEDAPSAADTPDADYVEDRFLQVMADEFDAVLEDGSAEAVAKDLVRLWAEVALGRDALVREFFVYLFKEAIICVVEEKKRSLGRLLSSASAASASSQGTHA